MLGRNIFLFFFMALLSSCAIHNGHLSADGTYQNSHKTTALAVGTAKVYSIFSIGGLGSDALLLEAKQKLYKNFPLKENQVYGNFTVDYKRSFYFIYSKTEVVITADVMTAKTESKKSVRTSTELKSGDKVYLKGDSKKVLSAYLLSLEDEMYCKVLVFSEKDRVKIKVVDKKRFIYFCS